ncbi:hypothetical protein EJD97_006545 [Solanum chilense]|uniref:Protein DETOXIFICATION n=1 Tax=Solanum chilense TaxID=4083 RepID=A0A6N2AIS9_SOLCI|nr:hypothetical protein EJD97_006545 [Solanum chilense]
MDREDIEGPLIEENVISIMFVDHLGELSLSGASMATSFASVSVLSLLLRLASALDTLRGQSYGAKQYHMQRAMLVLPLASAQKDVIPMMFSAGITTLLHIFTCWILAFKSGLGNKGAALANCISYWINLLLLAVYVRVSPSCYALPYTCSMVYMIPLGLSGATSARVSNELGAGRPQAARLAASTAVYLVATEGVIAAIVLIAVRKLWGYCYGTEEEVVSYVAQMLVLLAGSHFLDGIQSVLSGTARGCGWQKIGAVVNLGAYYLFGIPAGVILAFVYHLGGKGLWLGITLALFAQALLLLIVTLQTNWKKDAKKAADRVTSELANIEQSAE